MNATGKRLLISPLFTLIGKWGHAYRPSQWLAAAAVAPLLLLLPAEAAATEPQMGSSAAASVEIRLTVARQYAVRLGDHANRGEVQAGRGSICLSTNGEPGSLPVLLVKEGGAESAPRSIGWCGAGGNFVDNAASGLLILRPE